MSSNKVRFALESHITANFTTCPIAYPNVKNEIDTTATHIAVNFDFQAENTVSIGSIKTYRAEGQMLINVHAPQGVGTKICYDIADELKVIFRNKNISGVKTKSPSVVGTGIVEEGFYSILLIVPFYVDELE